MTLEQQVCSLESAKRLKELGVKQESLYHWRNSTLTAYNWRVDTDHTKQPVFWLDDKSYDDDDAESNDYKRTRVESQEELSAFTVAELGEMLPTDIKALEGTAWFETRKKTTTGQWMVAYDWDEDAYVKHADTEAEARAKMLIYLLENELTSFNNK